MSRKLKRLTRPGNIILPGDAGDYGREASFYDR